MSLQKCYAPLTNLIQTGSTHQTMKLSRDEFSQLVKTRIRNFYLKRSATESPEPTRFVIDPHHSSGWVECDSWVLEIHSMNPSFSRAVVLFLFFLGNRKFKKRDQFLLVGSEPHSFRQQSYETNTCSVGFVVSVLWMICHNSECQLDPVDPRNH